MYMVDNIITQEGMFDAFHTQLADIRMHVLQ